MRNLTQRRRFLALAAAGASLPGLSLAQGTPPQDPVAKALFDQLFGATSEHEAGLEMLVARGNLDAVAALVLSMRFSRRRAEAYAEALDALTGAGLGTNWFEWMLWQERHPEVVPHAGYADLMRAVHLQIDPNFDAFLRTRYMTRDAARIRVEEITWGGVIKDGIPSLDMPELIPAAAAEYMRDDDLVFGVAINGDQRAYPLRIMGWHEMFNEVIGGVPVALAYCTLCGSGILFETQVPGRDAPFVFGSSGFLYRSNKLMFDRETDTLWNQFTGKPVVGPLVGSGLALAQRPVVITTWAQWKADNPGTRILSLNTGHRRDYGSGVVYNDYFGSPDLMFPALVDESTHRQKDYVFAIRAFGAARAWPIKAFGSRPVINDAIADTPLVLLGDPASRAVRAYERGTWRFEQADAGLVDADGGTWTVTEEALLRGDGQSLPRVAGHIAYWFAWNNYLGDTASVYTE